uniref:Uncharacterized protein n=1 Tax=Cebus imitator TaxID=2715852 RepID=A0A2K5QRV7_CEBIM
VFRADDLTIFNLRNFLLFQLWDSRKDSWGPRATSSTTDSSRAPSSRPPGSTSRCGISTEGTQWCLRILPLRTSQVPDMMSFSISNQDLHGCSTSPSALGLAWKKYHLPSVTS